AKEIFDTVEAALTLHGILEVVVPVPARVDLVSVMGTIERWQPGIRRHSHQPWSQVQSGVEGGIAVRGAMRITEGNQGAHFEGVGVERRRPERRAYGIVHDGAV